MEDWIAQLCCSLNKDEDGPIGEKIATILGDNYPYCGSILEETHVFPSMDPLESCEYDLMMSEPPSLISSNMDTESDNKSGNFSEQKKREEEESNKGRAKRKRQPSQIRDHIMAERRRRELLTRQFITLSAIVPGLKKTDKTSVLGEAIKYMQELKEKLKALEEVVAKQTVESVIVVRKSQLLADDHDDGDDHDDDDDDDSNKNKKNKDNVDCENYSLPQIEVKMCDKELLFKICCEKQKGILPRLLSEVENCNMTIINSSIIPFGSLALHITILAQMDTGFDKNVKSIIRRLQTVFHL